MELQLILDGRHDLVGQLYRQLRDAILHGRLATGDRLPATRYLAERLEVSRKTVSEAYERLTSEGFLEGRVGTRKPKATPNCAWRSPATWRSTAPCSATGTP